MDINKLTKNYRGYCLWGFGLAKSRESSASSAATSRSLESTRVGSATRGFGCLLFRDFFPQRLGFLVALESLLALIGSLLLQVVAVHFAAFQLVADVARVALRAPALDDRLVGGLFALQGRVELLFAHDCCCALLYGIKLLTSLAAVSPSPSIDVLSWQVRRCLLCFWERRKKQEIFVSFWFLEVGKQSFTR